MVMSSIPSNRRWSKDKSGLVCSCYSASSVRDHSHQSHLPSSVFINAIRLPRCSCFISSTSPRERTDFAVFHSREMSRTPTYIQSLKFRHGPGDHQYNPFPTHGLRARCPLVDQALINDTAQTIRPLFAGLNHSVTHLYAESQIAVQTRQFKA